MQLNLGENIRQLRRRDGCTQEALANALGVTSQAVSRWESGGSYPDMEIMPAIANYFGVTIDALFGYQNDRERKIEDILARVEAYGLKFRSDDAWVDDCLAILRQGLAEFPRNERLLLALADTLSEAGWRRHKEWLYYDEEGFLQHRYDLHKTNEYWLESIKLCEYLADHARDNAIANRAISIAVLLYRNFGEWEKAAAFAQRMPELKRCRELMLAGAADGKEESGYIGDFLLKAAAAFADQMVYGLMVNRHHYESDMPIDKLKGAISLFHLLCDDGNLGIYHGNLVELYLYLSRIQWERGHHDEAFASLEEALGHARRYEEAADGEEHSYTAPLVSFVRYRAEPRKLAVHLPEDWPMWCHPDFRQVEKEIKADPRWAEWVRKTQQ